MYIFSIRSVAYTNMNWVVYSSNSVYAKSDDDNQMGLHDKIDRFTMCLIVLSLSSKASFLFSLFLVLGAQKYLFDAFIFERYSRKIAVNYFKIVQIAKHFRFKRLFYFCCEYICIMIYINQWISRPLELMSSLSLRLKCSHLA